LQNCKSLTLQVTCVLYAILWSEQD
jgi:hypothetical protein